MPYRVFGDGDEGDVHTGSRLCRACGERKNMTDFYLTSSRIHRHRTCKACQRDRARERRSEDPEKYAKRDRQSRMLREYGLTEDQYQALLDSQSSRCAICRGALTSPHVDHDHSTGRVRGILCFTCNTALGKFHDSVEVLESAIEYLMGNVVMREDVDAA